MERIWILVKVMSGLHTFLSLLASTHLQELVTRFVLLEIRTYSLHGYHSPLFWGKQRKAAALQVLQGSHLGPKRFLFAVVEVIVAFFPFEFARRQRKS